MHSRPRRHAEILVHYASDAKSGDEVVVITDKGTNSLAESICRELGSVGAIPVIISGGTFLTGQDNHVSSYLETSNQPSIPSTLVSLLKSADAICHLRACQNAAELTKTAGETIATYHKKYKNVLEAALFENNYTLTQVPTASGAQLASMDTEAFAEYVANATIRNWEAQAVFQEKMAKLLMTGKEIHLLTDSGTDITFSISGNKVINDDGSGVNLPGGEVYTAPVLDSINGKITFDIPRMIDGRELSQVVLYFENGDIVDFSSQTNEEYLETLLSLDEGSNQIGEFGVGMNPDLDRVTKNMALDEKMHGTVHFALGTAYESCIGQENERNKSAIHVDMLLDMREDARMTIDGNTVLRDGEFLFDTPNSD